MRKHAKIRQNFALGHWVSGVPPPVLLVGLRPPLALPCSAATPPARCLQPGIGFGLSHRGVRVTHC